MPRTMNVKKAVNIGGIVFEVYSPHVLGEALHRRPSTLRVWEWMKRIPKPILKTRDGLRWYTKEEIDVYIRLADEEQIKNGKAFDSTKFTARLFGEIKLLERKLIKEIGDAQDNLRR